MNILYKYCDPIGGRKILKSQKLRLPSISKVNDPFECLPIFTCTEDKAKIKERCLFAFKRRNILVTEEIASSISAQIESGQLQKTLKERSLSHIKEWHSHKGFLLSVSKTAQNTVMWAHYARKHTGLVIGIDFDSLCQPGHTGIVMEDVKYSNDRPRIDVSLDQDDGEWWDTMQKTLMFKSTEWQYEEELRTIFLDDNLKEWKEKGWATYKLLQNTWFLNLNPASIREVIFGLFTKENLKLKIRKLIKQKNLKHVKLRQAVESDTYTLDINEI